MVGDECTFIPRSRIGLADEAGCDAHTLPDAAGGESGTAKPDGRNSQGSFPTLSTSSVTSNDEHLVLRRCGYAKR